jgi:hypothetical protein
MPSSTGVPLDPHTADCAADGSPSSACPVRLASYTRWYPSIGSPQPPSRIPRLPLQLPELLQVFEWEPGVRKPVPLPDNLGVHECAVFEVDIGEGTAIFVVALLVILQLPVWLTSPPFLCLSPGRSTPPSPATPPWPPPGYSPRPPASHAFDLTRGLPAPGEAVLHDAKPTDLRCGHRSPPFRW